MHSNHHEPTNKFVIYQLLPRLFGNSNTTNKFYGSIEENGCGKLNNISKKALKSIKELGVTHIWYTGVIEHATLTDYSKFGIKNNHPAIVKGIAGSPYAIKDYYDIGPDLAENVEHRMAEFEQLVKRTHDEKLKVIIDFIPNHVAREYFSDAKPVGVIDFGEADNTDIAFSPNNNFYYLTNQYFNVPDGVNSPIEYTNPYFEYPAKATGNDVFKEKPSINDWYETAKLNYGINYNDHRTLHFHPIPDTWLKMRDILLYWSAKGVDGFRCDMAEMVPVEFWAWVTKEIKKDYPSTIFIAEIYNPQQYHNYLFQGGFDYLYDKVGLYDTVRKLMEGHGNASDITSVWQNESGEFAERMLRFLENHDEQRITAHEFAGDAKFGPLAMALSTYLHAGPVMIYNGQELGVKSEEAEGFQGNDGRTTIFDYWGLEAFKNWNNGGEWNLEMLDEPTKSLRKQYVDLLQFALKNDAVKSGGFYDLQYANNNGQSMGFDPTRIYAFIRHSKNQKLLFVFNFDHRVSEEFELQLPSHAYEYIGLTRKRQVIKNQYEDSFVLSEKGMVDLKIPPYTYYVFALK